MKRPAWDYNVNVTCSDVYGDSREVKQLSYPISQLTALGLFSNCPPPEEGDLKVDLVEQGLSPYPVTGAALEGLVELIQPLALSDVGQSDPLDSWRSDRNGPPRVYELLDAVDALCLDEAACKGLDQLVAKHLEHERCLLCVNSSQDGWGRITLDDYWEDSSTSEQCLHMTDGNSEFEGELKAAVLLPVVRWAVLQLYSKLDSMRFHKSQCVLAKAMVRPGRALLYGDSVWAAQLSEYQAGGSLSAKGQANLFRAAVSVHESSELMPTMEGVWSTTFKANIKDVVLGHKVALSGGVVLQHDCDEWIIMPLGVTYP